MCTHDCVCMCDEIVLVSSHSQIVELAGYTSRASEMFRVFREVKAGKCIMTSTVARDNEGNCIVPTIHTTYVHTVIVCSYICAYTPTYLLYICIFQCVGLLTYSMHTVCIATYVST